jgi:hypothetical protein
MVVGSRLARKRAQPDTPCRLAGVVKSTVEATLKLVASDRRPFLQAVATRAGGVATLGGTTRRPMSPTMTELPDDNLDHYALGFYALGKGLRREDCPYADGIEAHAQWIAGYDAAVKEREQNI